MNQDLIVGIGEVLWDILPDERIIGGAPANFAHHVSQFGLPGCLVSAVGDDILGEELLSAINRSSIIPQIEHVQYPTGTVTVKLDDAGIPCYDITSNTAWDNIPYTKNLNYLARRTRAVCFGSLAQRNIVSRETITSFISKVRNNLDSLIIFDANLRENYYTSDILSDSMSQSDVLKLNDEELVVLSKMFCLKSNDIANRCKELMNLFSIKILILTCGVNGSYVFTDNDFSFLPTPGVDVIDTVGAGDSFTASFVASLLKGRTIFDSHIMAVKTSAYVCSQKGATPILPEKYLL